MNLNVPFPPPNTPEVWDYNNTDRKNIQKGIKKFNLMGLFINFTINEREKLLSKTLLNIFRNYIPNKKINLNMMKHRR